MVNELVFYCCITNYQKLTDQKQHPFISSQFCRSHTKHGVAGFSVRVSQSLNQGFHQTVLTICRIKGRILCQPHVTCWQNSTFWSPRIEVPLFLLAVSWGPLSAPRGCFQFLALWSPPSQKQRNLPHIKFLSCFEFLELPELWQARGNSLLWKGSCD